MSGGSMNYLCHRVENDADFQISSPERKAFMAHLKKVAKALHDLEWVDSGDYGPGDELESIMACITPAEVLGASIEDAIHIRDQLNACVDRALAEKTGKD